MTTLVAFTIVRIAAGTTVAAHGAQKAFGWWGGPGPDRWIQTTTRLGFRTPKPFAIAAAIAELAGGIALALGFLTPLTAAAVATVMLVAIAKVHWTKGFFATVGGFELPLLLFTIAAMNGLAGPGPLSIDAWAGLPTAPPLFVGLTGISFAVALYASRRVPAKPDVGARPHAA